MKYIIGILLFLVIVNGVLIGTEVNSRKESFKAIENKYRDEISILRGAISKSERDRILLDHRIDSLGAINKSLLGRLNETNAELTKVKGRYNKHTPSELEKEMIKKYNENK